MAASLHYFVLPPVDDLPAHADVIFELGPPIAARSELVRRLLADGRVDAALVSVPEYARTQNPELVDELCSTSKVTCAAPEPSTTRGEARLLARYATREHWTSAVVVTQTAHVSRARMLMRRCFTGRLAVVASGEAPADGWLYQAVYQTGSTIKAWSLPGC
ncbi:ElyC/SanA/YdcF family protein [Amnibacterium soli]|uniref:ElyC/SanA/YdcF family protein n=1 Tax=Amnibacterium soli TaxID=1282736 RepID=UPI0031E9F7BD